MKQRIEYIDLAKGICILLVVLLHVYGDTSGTAIRVMNLFRMPLYFVLSGLFFKSYGGLFPFIKKKTNKLLLPFAFFFLFVSIPSSAFLEWRFGTGEVGLGELLLGENGKLNLGINGASWFLLCLFFVNVWFYVAQLLCRGNVVWLAVLSLGCGLVGYALGQSGLFLPLWIDSSLTAMPFFLLGYVSRKYSDILSEPFSRKHLWMFAAALCCLLSVFAVDEAMGRGVIAFGDNHFDIPAASLYLGGMAGTWCVLMFSKRITHVPVISYLGRYSIVVLLTHLIYLFVLRNLLYQLHVPMESGWINFAVFLLIVLLSLPTVRLGTKYLPYCFAQKDLWK